MLERPFSVAVTGVRLTIADELIFVGGEAFKANRPACVQFASADAKLCAQTVAEAIGEARRSVVINTRGINSLHEMCCRIAHERSREPDPHHMAGPMKIAFLD